MLSRTSALVQAGLSLALLSGVALVPMSNAGVAEAAPPPNIVLILTDDHRWDQIGYMPTVQSELVGKGSHFLEAFVVNSLCCPSRATILTGQYSHTTGVYDNRWPFGGVRSFKARERSTIATWLDDAGYETALVGKYLNGYSKKTVSNIPPGWDTWNALADLHVAGVDYYHYPMSIDGQLREFGPAESDYQTDVLNRFATDFIRGVPEDRPLFLHFSPWAPHTPTQVPVRYRTALTNFERIRPPNLNEADVSDKPAYVRSIPLSTSTGDSQRLKMLRAVLPVDDAVRDILDALSDTGRLANTLILFAADNGVSVRSHRWVGKRAPWEEVIRIPLVIRYDPLTLAQATTDHHLALNLDFAATFADAAGVSTPGSEGVSLLPLLDGTATEWRSRFVIEHLQDNPKPPTYCAIRTTQYKYVRYETGEEELYDLHADPFELVSQHANPAFASLKADLRAELAQMCSPPPPDPAYRP